MLARENRLVRAEDFRTVMKSGRKVATDHLVIYLKRDEAAPHARFGFVVAKTVGGAVRRNLVKRRLRELAREMMRLDVLSSQNSAQFQVVVRALPGSAEIDWNRLREEFFTGMKISVAKTAS